MMVQGEMGTKCIMVFLKFTAGPVIGRLEARGDVTAQILERPTVETSRDL